MLTLPFYWYCDLNDVYFGAGRFYGLGSPRVAYRGRGQASQHWPPPAYHATAATDPVNPGWVSPGRRVLTTTGKLVPQAWIASAQGVPRLDPSRASWANCHATSQGDLAIGLATDPSWRNLCRHIKVIIIFQSVEAESCLHKFLRLIKKLLLS